VGLFGFQGVLLDFFHIGVHGLLLLLELRVWSRLSLSGSRHFGGLKVERALEVGTHVFCAGQLNLDLSLQMLNHLVFGLQDAFEGLFAQLVHQLEFPSHGLLQLVAQTVALALGVKHLVLKFRYLASEQRQVVCHLLRQFRRYLGFWFWFGGRSQGHSLQLCDLLADVLFGSGIFDCCSGYGLLQDQIDRGPRAVLLLGRSLVDHFIFDVPV
jgi:hypothetical protein